MSTGFELPGEGSAVEAGHESPGETRPTFGSVRRGYDPSEVDAFLAQVASSIKILETRSREAARGETPDDVTDRLTERFAKIVALQEREVETLLTEAHAEAATTVAEAKQEADRILCDARDAAERSVEDAHASRERSAAEADDLRSGLAERRREMIESLPQFQQRLLMFLQEVEEALGSIEESDAE
jgi:DivIVA domain-containing protein